MRAVIQGGLAALSVPDSGVDPYPAVWRLRHMRDDFFVLPEFRSGVEVFSRASHGV